MSDGTLAKRISDLREKASRCRHAAASAESTTAATLRAYAVELEADASRLAATLQEPEPVLPTQALPHEQGNAPHTEQAAAALKSEIPAEPPADQAGNTPAG